MHVTDEHDVLVIGAGQAGLAAAYHLKNAGARFTVLEAGSTATGSWARYYDSLVLFSPARFSELPGLAFGGDANRYPTRDEVAAYLERYAAHFEFPIRFQARVTEVRRSSNGHFVVETADGSRRTARAIVAATGSFSTPNVPRIKGEERFRGSRIHALEYRSTRGWEGKRILVVGAGNTAVQIAYELAQVSDTRLATRTPVRYVPQQVLGKDIHFWFHRLGLNKTQLFSDHGTPVIEDGRYRRAIEAGRPARIEMFTEYTEDGVIHMDGRAENIDAVIYGTGYRDAAPYLRASGALDEQGLIVHQKGLSTRVPGLGFVGFSHLRNFASATLRGVGPDAKYVVNRLMRHLARSS